MSFYEVDQRADPVLLFRFTREATDDEYRDYVAHLDRLAKDEGARPHGVGLILDLRAGGKPSGPQREMMGTWAKDNGALLERRSIGIVYVLDGAAQRFILASMMVVAPIRGPYKVAASIQEAVDFFRKQFRERGLDETALSELT